MVSYHVSGTVCRAVKRACPLGEGEHFDSPEAAMRAGIERDLAATEAEFYGGTLERELAAITRGRTLLEVTDSFEAQDIQQAIHNWGEAYRGDPLTDEEVDALQDRLMEDVDADWDYVTDKFMAERDMAREQAGLTDEAMDEMAAAYEDDFRLMEHERRLTEPEYNPPPEDLEEAYYVPPEYEDVAFAQAERDRQASGLAEEYYTEDPYLARQAVTEPERVTHSRLPIGPTGRP